MFIDNITIFEAFYLRKLKTEFKQNFEDRKITLKLT